MAVSHYTSTINVWVLVVPRPCWCWVLSVLLMLTIQVGVQWHLTVGLNLPPYYLLVICPNFPVTFPLCFCLFLNLLIIVYDTPQYTSNGLWSRPMAYDSRDFIQSVGTEIISWSTILICMDLWIWPHIVNLKKRLRRVGQGKRRCENRVPENSAVCF